MLARPVDHDRLRIVAVAGRVCRRLGREGERGSRRRLAGKRLLIGGECDAGERCGAGAHLCRRARTDNRTAALAAFGSQINDPVRRAHHIEVVLDDENGMPGGEEFAKCAQKLCDVLEVQARCRLIEKKELAQMRRARCDGAGGGEVPRELQTLGLAARERRDRLAELQVFEPYIAEGCEARRHLARVGKERARLGHRHLEHLGDARAAPIGALVLDVEHLAAVAAAGAIRAAQVDVREELHLHVLKAIATAGRAAAVAGIEAEGAGAVLALLRGRLRRIELPYRIESAHVACRI